MKFVLFVEGHTEENVLADFFKRWLDPRLPQRVGIKSVVLTGWQTYYNEIARKVERNLSGKPGADVIAGIGLLDLYGPQFYPSDKLKTDERRTWAKAHLEQRVAHPRFRQHFAVHELEAWILAQPEILPREVRASLPGRSAQPELVNFNEPPAKLLERLYRDRLKKSYKKIIDGVGLFRSLSPGRAYERCPSLKLLLDDMLDLAKQSLT